jgi:phosphoglycolate phosphatase-like HAD superfamily hydrolase
MPRSRVLLLFDIDGTLLVTGGVAREAFSCAVREVFAIADDLAGVEFAGRTEPLIVADILFRRGLAFRDGEEARFWDALVRHMERLFVPPKGRLLAGVTELLATLDRRPDLSRALLTGNLSRVARVKLARFGSARRPRTATRSPVWRCGAAWSAWGSRRSERSSWGTRTATSNAHARPGRTWLRWRPGG